MAQIVDIVNKKDELSQTIENFSKADLSEPELQLQTFIGPEKQMARGINYHFAVFDIYHSS